MDIELLDTKTIINGLRFPFKVNKVTQVVIAEGEISCIVDFFSYALKAPSVAIFFLGQVIESIESCLSSTTMTVQEISDELDFPSQSVFGKYFKRVEGMSPKAYRQSLEKL